MPCFKRAAAFLLLITAATAACGKELLNLSVTGVKGEALNNVRHYLDLKRLSCGVSELHLINALDKADTQVSAALRALGYYNADWQISHRRDESGKSPCWQVSVDITPGVATTVDELRVRFDGPGSDDAQLQAMLEQLPVKPGDRVHHGRYEQMKKLIHQGAQARGYFDGAFAESRLRINRSANSATVDLVYATGPRYRIGSIRISDTPLSDRIIERYLVVAEGDPYLSADLIKSQGQLINARYFDRVSVDQREPDRDSHEVDIDIDLAVKSRYESIVGAGFSTDLGPRVNYQLRDRRFNDQGDTYELRTQFSPVQSQFGFQFQQPGTDPINEKTLWSLAWQREDTDTYDSESYSADVARIKVMGSGWVRTTSLNLLVEDFDVASDSDSVVFLYPGLNFHKSKANNRRYPTSGWRLSAGVLGGLDQALSSTTFAQGTLSAKVILPLLGGRLIGQGGAGATYAEDFAKIPATLRFFAGGDNSVRGYDYESLGPTDEEGEVLGGKYLLTGSVEYDHKVYKDYSLAVFYDAGNAFNNEQFTIRESVGFGVRWHSPIGTIKADLAFPLESDSVRLHLSMGPDL